MPSYKRKRIPENPNSSISKRMRSMRKSTVGSLTRKVNKILSEQERKNLDTAATQALIANTAVIVPLSSIPQGDDAVSRDGRKVSYVSTQIRAQMATIATNGDSAGFRVIILRDIQSNGITPVAADILTAPTNHLSPLTLDFKERFRVVYDNFSGLGKGDLSLNLDGATGVTGAGIPMKYFYRFKDDEAQAEYGGIGNIPTSNSLLMLVIAQSAATFRYYHRLRFTDS